MAPFEDEKYEDKTMNTEDAFSVLNTQGHAALGKLQSEGKELFGRADFEGAKKIAEKAQKVTALIRELENLQSRWQECIPEPVTVIEYDLPIHKTPNGEITIQPYYRIPILQALIEMGGSGATSRVIDRVGEIMKDYFSDVDNQLLPSGRDIRWRNNCAWHRYTMVQDGLLVRGSQVGTWEISPKGREYFNQRIKK